SRRHLERELPDKALDRDHADAPGWRAGHRAPHGAGAGEDGMMRQLAMKRFPARSLILSSIAWSGRSVAQSCPLGVNTRGELARQSLECLTDRVLRAVDRADDGRMRVERLWRRLVPERAGLIHGYVIPHDRTAVLLAQQVRDQMSLVPVLGSSAIRDTPERCRRRSGQIGRQD